MLYCICYDAIFIQYRARGDCHIWHCDNVPAGGADPGGLHDGAPGAESKEEGDGDAEEDSEGWGSPVQLLLIQLKSTYLFFTFISVNQ